MAFGQFHYSYFLATIQPSVRDAILPFANPTLERVGYSRFSLREIGRLELCDTF